MSHEKPNMFIDLSLDYDRLTDSIIPQYGEMQRVVRAAIDQRAKQHRRFLDIGCGTAQTLQHLLTEYHQASGAGIDSSPEMLTKARTRLAGLPVQLQQADIREADYGTGYDVVLSVAALNNMNRDYLPEIYSKIHHALGADGIFVHADFIAHENPVINSQLDRLYEAHVRAAINDEAFLQTWFQEYAENFYPATLSRHWAYLEAAGFREIELNWLYQSQAVFSARK